MSRLLNPSFKISLILVLLMLLVDYSTIFAQTSQPISESDDAQYGIKAGINFAELIGEDAIPESDRKVGYSFGVYASYKLTKELKLQPELIWSLQGEKSPNKGRYDISYLNVPIMLKWTEGKFYSELGPQFGFLTINSSNAVPDDIRLTNFETLDFSINAGLGYELFEDLIIGFRYNQGLTNIVDGRDLNNSVLYFGVSYRIF